MPKRRGKPRSWGQDPRWVTRGVAAYEDEWASFREAAGLHGGVTLNGWVRLWLLEAVLFERANARDREDLGGEADEA